MDSSFPSVVTVSEVNGPQGSDVLHNNSAQIVYNYPIQESAAIDPYNARLLQMVSSVPFTGDFDWAEIRRWDDSGNVV
jgi:hypothetical protein